MERTGFLHAGTHSRKLKAISVIFGWAWPFSSLDPKAKKDPFCFQKCGWQEKFSPGQPQTFFFIINFLEIFSFLLCFHFFFFVFLFFYFFVLWNEIYIFWYTFDYVDGWVAKIFSPSPFLETRLLFGLKYAVFDFKMRVYCSCTCFTPWGAGRILWNKVHPSFHPAVCPGGFLELDHKFPRNLA